jgi:hypothetical protein
MTELLNMQKQTGICSFQPAVTRHKYTLTFPVLDEAIQTALHVKSEDLQYLCNETATVGK